ncbi:membrane protein [Rhodococcus erythropolis]|jgi:drug/metabolite transporter (DMT)-like permease|uniref:Membrane protein n=2 Tax=Rhodococcus TaxID=1827 RepID=A0A6G9CT03_RHOER|nr:membrane protein [Rhodococcus erythropolis]
MSMKSSAIVAPQEPLPMPSSRSGLWWGLLGVLAFSFTVPLTRVAVADLDPLFVGAGRAVVAGALAIVMLSVTRATLPTLRQWFRIALVTVGAVLGFSLFTTFALQTSPASHAAVVIGLLPAATAVFAVVRGKERPSKGFWWASAAGAVSVVGFVAIANGGLGSFHLADLLLFAAVVCAALAYSEGALLAREIGSWQTIAWALILGLPVTIALTVASMAQAPVSADVNSWLSFAYLGCVSMFLGFFPWYRGLAIGPISTVSQTQLVQPVLSIAWSALILGEALSPSIVAGGVVVIGCAWLALKARVAAPRAVPARDATTATDESEKRAATEGTAV